MINAQRYQSHPVFDNEDAIVKAGNAPAPVDLAPWQERINRIAGCTPTNKPRLRIVWGQDLDNARQLIFGKWFAKYPFWRTLAGEEIHEIGEPRFYVEELHDVDELGANDNWERARYQRDPQTGFVLADVLGPMPQEGFYTALFAIAHHDDLCCGGREVIKGQPCLGAFRPPSDADLTRIRRIIHNKEQAARSQVNPNAEDIHRQNQNFIAVRDAERRKRIDAAVGDFMKTHGWKFTEHDPAKLANGRFHFLSGHNKSGTPKDETNVSSSSASVA